MHPPKYSKNSNEKGKKKIFSPMFNEIAVWEAGLASSGKVPAKQFGRNCSLPPWRLNSKHENMPQTYVVICQPPLFKILEIFDPKNLYFTNNCLTWCSFKVQAKTNMGPNRKFTHCGLRTFFFIPGLLCFVQFIQLLVSFRSLYL